MDVHQCAAVLGYVQYRYNPALPLAALKARGRGLSAVTPVHHFSHQPNLIPL